MLGPCQSSPQMYRALMSNTAALMACRMCARVVRAAMHGQCFCGVVGQGGNEGGAVPGTAQRI